MSQYLGRLLFASLSKRMGLPVIATLLFGQGAAHAVVNVGSDLHGHYDGCIAKFTAAGLRDKVDHLDRSRNTFKFIRKAGTVSNPDDRTRASNGTGTGGETYFNPTDSSQISGEASGVRHNTCATLYHEMHHLVDYDNGKNDTRVCMGTGGITVNEVEAVRSENRYRATQPDLKDALRAGYGSGTRLPPDGTPCQTQ